MFELTRPTDADAPWMLATVAEFGTGPNDGGGPSASVTIGRNGVLYGTTYLGGEFDRGTVYSLTPPTETGKAWTKTIIHSFRRHGDGTNPTSEVTMGERGVLYGTTGGGGAFDHGTVYQLSPPGSRGGEWTPRILTDFGGFPGDGIYPDAGVTLATDGNLYGVTRQGGTFGYGTVYKIVPEGR